MTEYGDTTVADLNQRYNQAKAARIPYEADWMLNRAFFEGNQWVMYSHGRLSRPYIDPRRDLVTDNRIKAVITSRVARKAKNRPMFSATPQGGDDMATNSARISERVLDNDWEELELQPKLFRALLWADVCSNGFLKVFWDRTKGDKTQFVADGSGQPVMNPEDGTPLKPDELPEEITPETQGDLRIEEIAQGDVAVEVKTPFELFPDPLATGMDDLEWMIDETVRSVEYVKKQFPTDVNGNPFEPVTDSNSGETPGGVISMVPADGASEYEGVKVREYWCKPNTEHPDGWYVCWINDTIVVAEEPFDPMPYVAFDSAETPGRFWARAITSDLRGPQHDLNVIRTQIKENAKRLGNPALLKSRQANVRYQGVPGEEILYDSSVQDAIPSYLQPPNLPPYVENEIARIEKSIEEISGMHEVSRATVPTGVTAASAINLLQEADETRLGPEIQQMEFALGRLGTKVLRLRAKFNTDERLFRIAGQDGNWDIQGFKGEMLGDDPRVTVQAGSQMPRSKAAKQAAMTEVLGLIVQYGVKVDERALRKFLQNYEVGGLEMLFQGVTEDAKQTNREHRIMGNGEPLEINPNIDNHQFHIDEHTEYMKTDRFWQMSPDVRNIFNQHVLAHRQFMVQMVDNQVEQQVLQGAPVTPTGEPLQITPPENQTDPDKPDSKEDK